MKVVWKRRRMARGGCYPFVAVLALVLVFLSLAGAVRPVMADSSEDEYEKQLAIYEVALQKRDAAKAKYDEAVQALEAVQAEKNDLSKAVADAQDAKATLLRSVEDGLASAIEDYEAKVQKALEAYNTANKEKEQADKDLQIAEEAIQGIEADTLTERLASAQKAKEEAQEAYDIAKATVDKGVAGFYEENGSETALRVLGMWDAYLKKQLAWEKGEWATTNHFVRAYKDYILLTDEEYKEAETHFLELANMKTALRILKQYNRRRKENGLSELMVHDTAMATAQMASRACWYKLAHEFVGSNQNCGFNYAIKENDSDEWCDNFYKSAWDEEKENYESGNGGMTGHYLTCIDNWQVTGLGYSPIGSYTMISQNFYRIAIDEMTGEPLGGGAQMPDGSYVWALDAYYGRLTLEDYTAKFLAYCDRVEGNLATAEKNLKNAKNNLKRLESSYADQAKLIENYTKAKARAEQATITRTEALNTYNKEEIFCDILIMTTVESLAYTLSEYPTFASDYPSLAKDVASLPEAEKAITIAEANLAKKEPEVQSAQNAVDEAKEQWEAEEEALSLEGTSLDQLKIDIRRVSSVIDLLFEWVIKEHNIPYDGTEQMPITAQDFQEATGLFEVKDFIIFPEDNLVAGEGDVFVSGVGRYKGTVSFPFTIVPADITNATLEIISADEVYSPNGNFPDIMLSMSGNILEEGIDYTVSYKGTGKIGTASMTVHGIGNYTGSITRTFKIVKKSLVDENGEASDGIYVKLAKKSIPYTGEKKAPAFTITYEGRKLVEGTDYKYWTEKAGKAGTASLVIKGLGNYTGVLRVPFTVAKVAIGTKSGASVTLKQERYNYQGGVRVVPKFVVKYNGMTLQEGVDYKFGTENAKAVGTATLIVKGIGNYKGTFRTTYSIVRRSAKYVKAALPKASYAYTGKAIRPQPVLSFMANGKKVVLQKGTDYTLSYASNKGRGTAAVKILLKGNYQGKMTVRFQIV